MKGKDESTDLALWKVSSEFGISICVLSFRYVFLGARPVSYLLVELHLFACDSDTLLSVSWFVTLLDLPLTCTLLKVYEILA